MATEETRMCNKCHIEKPITEYYYTKDSKSYRRDCRQCSGDRTKRWRLKNLDYARKKGRQHYRENKERHDEATALWREKNSEYVSNHKRQYRKDNLEKIKKKEREYNKFRRDKDLNHIFYKRFRSRIRKTLIAQHAEKSNTTYELTGCDWIELRKHFESLFTEGMTWNNHGRYGWHIDHITPCASFDLTDPDQQKICFHYSNLQPLWAEDNLKKGAKVG